MTLKDLNEKLTRWSIQLQAYDFFIEHRKGSENVVADNLSRLAFVSGMIMDGIDLDNELLNFE